MDQVINDKQILSYLKTASEIIYQIIINPVPPPKTPDKIFEHKKIKHSYYLLRSFKSDGIHIELSNVIVTRGLLVHKRFLTLSMENEATKELRVGNLTPGQTILSGAGLPPYFYYENPQTVNIKVIEKPTADTEERIGRKGNRILEKLKKVFYPEDKSDNPYGPLDFYIQMAIFATQRGFISSESIFKDFKEWYRSKFLDKDMQFSYDQYQKEIDLGKPQSDPTDYIRGTKTIAQPNPSRFLRYSVADWVLRRIPTKGQAFRNYSTYRLKKSDLFTIPDEVLRKTLEAVIKNFVLPYNPQTFAKYILDRVAMDKYKDWLGTKHIKRPSSSPGKDIGIDEGIINFIQEGWRWDGIRMVPTGKEILRIEAIKYYQELKKNKTSNKINFIY